MKKQILTGLIGAASLLAMAATSSYAYQYGTTCNSGTITNIGSVYLGTADNAPKAGMYRVLDITCNDPADWTLGSSFVLYPGLDNDGMLATALTAKSDGKNVKFVVFPYGKLQSLLGVIAQP